MANFQLAGSRSPTRNLLALLGLLVLLAIAVQQSGLTHGLRRHATVVLGRALPQQVGLPASVSHPAC